MKPNLPQLILAQVSIQTAISPPTHIKVGRSLLGQIFARQNEQSERSQQASCSCTAAGAAIVADVSLDCSLKFMFVDLKLGLDVNLTKHELQQQAQSLI